MNEDQDCSQDIDSPLPFGKRVYSQAYELENSVSIYNDQIGMSELLSIFKQNIENAKGVLEDKKLTKQQRVKQSLRILQQDVLNAGQKLIRSGLQTQQIPQFHNQLSNQETTQIMLEIRSSLNSYSSLSKQKGSSENSRKQSSQQQPKQSGGIDQKNELIEQLKRQLYSKQCQIILLTKEKRENQARLEEEIEELTRKIEAGHQPTRKVNKFQQKNPEMIKMNKWLETLNKLLIRAQRQAATSKEQLRRREDIFARHLKEKDQYIHDLRVQLKIFEQQKVDPAKILRNIVQIYEQLSNDEREKFKQKLQMIVKQFT